MVRRLLLALVVCPAVLGDAGAADLKPNIVLILADDLGYGDLGCYGQTKIKTPNLDRLAADGVRFTQCYAGSTVCAPSRCALMTGLHTGHCRVRGNGGGGNPRMNVALTKSDPCVADVLKRAGYATALVGKWGLGEENSPGVPNLKGFDFFYGYLNQVHAHNYYPDFLWRNWRKEPLQNGPSGASNVTSKRAEYAPDLCRAEAEKFIADNHDRPFFLYFATTLPHANNEKTRLDGNGNEVPTDAPYTDEKWPQPEKDKASMITRLDADVGALLAALTKHGLDDKTLVLFVSDNGPHKEGGNDPAFFASSGPLRGIKRSLHEGGIRIPAIARWPGVTKPGSVSDHVWAFWDFMPTAADIAGVAGPVTTDGLSILPTLTRRGEQVRHRYLYWEFHEGGFQQAVRERDWKAIRPGPGKPLRLYNLKADPGEATDVAEQNPAIVKGFEETLETARDESAEFPVLPVPRKN
ncbi:MAG: arylsulfatase [Fimbriiglobus sp.]